MSLTCKGTLNYNDARRVSRSIREANPSAFSQANGMASGRKGTREPSSGCAGDGVEHTDIVVMYKPTGYWSVCCAHDRVKWEPCTMCRRDKHEAAINFRLHQLGKL